MDNPNSCMQSPLAFFLPLTALTVMQGNNGVIRFEADEFESFDDGIDYSSVDIGELLSQHISDPAEIDDETHGEAASEHNNSLDCASIIVAKLLKENANFITYPGQIGVEAVPGSFDRTTIDVAEMLKHVNFVANPDQIGDGEAAPEYDSDVGRAAIRVAELIKRANLGSNPGQIGGGLREATPEEITPTRLRTRISPSRRGQQSSIINNARARRAQMAPAQDAPSSNTVNDRHQPSPHYPVLPPVYEGSSEHGCQPRGPFADHSRTAAYGSSDGHHPLPSRQHLTANNTKYTHDRAPLAQQQQPSILPHEERLDAYYSSKFQTYFVLDHSKKP